MKLLYVSLRRDEASLKTLSLQRAIEQAENLITTVSERYMRSFTRSKISLKRVIILSSLRLGILF